MHGIDTERFRPARDRANAVKELGLDPGQLHAGCFGRVRRQKGTDLFVDSMIELLPGRPRWSAIVAGRATAEHKRFEDDLKSRVARAGLTDRIVFVGEHRDIERWYRALSLYVAPQRWEGFGLTPLAAMASGVPVVATDVGAFSELVDDGKTGTIIPRDDLGAMKHAAAHLMDDDTQRLAAADQGLRRARSVFPLQGEADRLVEIYGGLTSTD